LQKLPTNTTALKGVDCVLGNRLHIDIYVVKNVI